MELGYILESAALGIAALTASVIVFSAVARIRTDRKLLKLEHRAKALKQSLQLAQDKFFSRQISEEVFNTLLVEYQSELVEIEFQAKVLHGTNAVNVDDAINKLSKRVVRLTKSQKHRLQSLLVENQQTLNEIKALENKSGRKELDPRAFRQLSQQKHKKSIETQLKIRAILGQPEAENKPDP